MVLISQTVVVVKLTVLMSHSAGRMVEEYESIEHFTSRILSREVDIRKFYQGCGHVVHNGFLYFHIAGLHKTARYIHACHTSYPLEIYSEMLHLLPTRDFK